MISIVYIIAAAYLCPVIVVCSSRIVITEEEGGGSGLATRKCKYRKQSSRLITLSPVARDRSRKQLFGLGEVIVFLFNIQIGCNITNQVRDIVEIVINFWNENYRLNDTKNDYRIITEIIYLVI